ncbi:leucine-rich repeat protein [Actinoplanes sp. NPDC026670]|uniref:leucine-rich repeat protein n=1 Tax=Actinoplanes sp. NPDC026670 TaxID=3154700 RepID=UPI0033D3B8B5
MAGHHTRAAVSGLVLLALSLGAAACSASGARSAPGDAPPSTVPTGAATPAGAGPAPASATATASAPASARPRGNPYRSNIALGDPTADPGPDPIFARDADLRRTGTYTYRFTKPGDHKLANGTYTLQYDVTSRTLKAELAGRRAKMTSATGIALYLTGGTALADADLAALQTAGRDLELPKLSRLYVYNLRTIQAGRECTPDSGLTCAGETARGGLFPYLWLNGWWDTWVEDLILDDLIAVPDGAFSNHTFAGVSMRSVRSIGVMGFGHAPRATWNVLYLPNVRTVAHDGFRRNQGFVKIVLPQVITIDDYGFDDATSLRYFNAPRLKRLGRNALNDSGALVSVNFPKLEYMGINSINGVWTGLRLPALTTVDKSAISNSGTLRWLYAPRLTDLRDDAIVNNAQLRAVYLGNAARFNTRALAGNPQLRQIVLGSRPPQQKADVFLGTGRATIFHTGSAAAWTGFTPSGNPSLPVRAWS